MALIFSGILIFLAAALLIFIVFIMPLRRVVPTNVVHIVQYAKKTVSYGKGQAGGGAELGGISLENTAWRALISDRKKGLPSQFSGNKFFAIHRKTNMEKLKLLLIASVFLFANGAVFARVFTSGGNSIVFSDKDGSIAKICRNGKDIASQADVAFAMRFIGKNGEYVYVDNSDFGDFRFDGNTAMWGGCKKIPSLKFQLKIAAQNGEFRFRPKASGLPKNLTLEYIEAPRISVPFDSEILFPFSEGVLVGDEQKNTRKVFHLASPDSLSAGYYPGIVQMQFIASYSKNGGLLFLADDPNHSTKFIEFSKDKSGNVGLRIENGCASETWADAYELPFELALKFFDGDWRDACTLYREHVKPAAKLLAPKKPRWFRDSPIVVTYCVRGRGELTHKTNKLVPYENAFPYIDKIAKATDSKIMALVMSWDHDGPWMPPYYWPPVCGEQSLKNFGDMLHKSGYLLGLYGSGTAYTIKSKIGDFSQQDRYLRENIAEITTRGAQGQRKMIICYNIREGEALCIYCPRARKILIDEILNWAKAGVDYAQYFDQNIGCASFLCYARNHGHPSVPGLWQTTAMRSLLKEINAEIGKINPEMILGTEAAAAEPYIDQLPFNDLRECFAAERGIPVPAFQWVYHAQANNFYGNQCNVFKYIDHAKNPENLQLRLAQAFCAGEMLTVYMLDNGAIYWSVMMEWTLPPPDQDKILTLLKNLNAMRKKYPQFLLDGEMVKPEFDVECDDFTLRTKKCDIKYPCVLTAAFRAPNGEIGHFFVNFTSSKKTFRATKDGKTQTISIEPLSVIFSGRF